MQSSHIPLFERFGVFSTVMPYFDTTHKSFYFLSQFNSQSRAMLDKYYEGFLNVMIENLATLEIEENEDIIKLPCNLFRYKIYLSCESRVEIFIKLIESINNENGCYFNKHLMNTRFCVDRICINEKFVKQLYPYLDLLKKTEVIDCTVNYENLLLIEKSSLINSISIYIDLHKDKYFPHYISTDEDKCELDSIFESFRKIDYLHLNRFEVESAIKCLTEAKDLKLQINSLLLYPETAEELEELTNPVFFVKGVNFVEFILDPTFAFTDIFYNNINTIKPGRLIFSIAEKPTEEFDYISIFANIKYKANIKLVKGSLWNKYELRFENVPIFIKKNRQDPIFIKCRNFVCYLKIEEFGDSFWLTKNKSVSIKNKYITFLHILNWNRLEWTNHVYVKDIDEINQLQDIFVEHLSESKLEQEFILSISNIKYVDIDMDQAQQTVIHKNGGILIKELSKAPSFMCTLRFSYLLSNIDKCLSLYPEKCFYSFENYGSFKYEIEKYIHDKYEEAMIKLSSIRVSKLRFFHLLTSIEIQLINRIISSSMSKFYLKSAIMYIYYIDDVIEVLGRLSDCSNIESVFIKYKYKSSKKIVFPENELEKAKRLFYKKVDVLCEVSIHNDQLMN